jgi:2-hydroxy-3-oxopropionate reductase
MGTPMAHHLIAPAGVSSCWSRSPRPDLVAAGATWTDTRESSPRDDAILVMLPDLPELEAALDGDGRPARRRRRRLPAPADRVDLFDRRARDRRTPPARPVGASGRGLPGLRRRRRRERRAPCRSCSAETDADAARRRVLSPCGRPSTGRWAPARSRRPAISSSSPRPSSALGEATELAAARHRSRRLWTLAAATRVEPAREPQDRLVAGDDSPSGAAAYMVKDLGFAADVAASTDTRPPLCPPCAHLRRDRRRRTRRPRHLGHAATDGAPSPNPGTAGRTTLKS